MDRFYKDLLEVLSWDPGDRGFIKNLPGADVEGLKNCLLKGESFLIVTGFPILKCKIGENDGPIGAVHIGYALHKLGKKVTFVTDEWSHSLVEVCQRVRGLDLEIISVPHDGGSDFCKGILQGKKPDVIITIERPSKGSDGHFHNMRGMIIDEFVSDTDSLLDCDAAVISIGDGGNEAGMGNFASIIKENVHEGALICAATTCDIPLAAGISNWWGWGIAAILSVAAGQNLLPTSLVESDMLRAVMAAGGVDGVLGKPSMTTDGVQLEQNLALLEKITALTPLTFDLK